MERSTFVQAAPTVACVVWVAMLVWWFWEYVDAVLHRRPGESVWQALERANKERKLNQKARAEMFGSRWVTFAASLLSVVLMTLTAVALARAPWLGLALCAYLVAGLFVIRRYDLRAHVSWARLTFSNRLWLRLTHAWLWPLHVLSGGTRVAKRNASTTEDIQSKE